MPAKKTPQKQSKSDFIRQQPATLSAAEIVAKGKAAGVTILPGLVYEVRRTAKVKRATAKRTSTGPNKVTTNSPVTASKADFVRARSHLSPKEIVEDAKTAGIKLEVTYVYNVRGSDKSKGKTKVTKQAARRATTPRIAPSVQRPITNSSSAEDLLRAVAAEVGLGRAVELLEAERARVHAVLRR